MNKTIKETLRSCRFAVLATEGEGQPHASLVAITPVTNYRQLLFATYRNTRKFRNLALNGRVAVLFETKNDNITDMQKGPVVTAYGNAAEIRPEVNESLLNEHLKNHPDLEAFLRTADCALILITVEAYQIVQSIDDVVWYPLDKN